MPKKFDSLAKELHGLFLQYFQEHIIDLESEFGRVTLHHINISPDRGVIRCALSSERKEEEFVKQIQPFIQDLRSRLFRAYDFRIRPELHFELPKYQNDPSRILHLIEVLNHGKK